MENITLRTIKYQCDSVKLELMEDSIQPILDSDIPIRNLQGGVGLTLHIQYVLVIPKSNKSRNESTRGVESTLDSLDYHSIWLDSRSYWWNHMELYFKPDITNSISSLLKGYITVSIAVILSSINTPPE